MVSYSKPWRYYGTTYEIVKRFAMSFLAYRVSEQNNQFSAAWESMELESLPPNEVLIEVKYSSVNYKDMLSATGHRGVSKHYPHTPGIDAAGTVVHSESKAFKAGDEVIVFGFDLGMNTPGGFAQRIRVPAAWVLDKPAGMSLSDCMAWGTAGFTAALSVRKLIRAGIEPSKGPIAVTGATGGVGSIAVALLSKLGFEVVAISRQDSALEFLQQLGASRIESTSDWLEKPHKALAKPLFQAVLDTLGGKAVTAFIPYIMPEGAITTCGMIQGTEFESSIFPFILRGIALLGVDSVEISNFEKQATLDKIAEKWQLDNIEEWTTEIGRKQLSDILQKLADGEAVGRYRLNLERD